MAHYICQWYLTGSIMLLPEYKENKKTISYRADFKWDYVYKKFRYKDEESLYMIKKNRLDEIGFIVEANTYEEARRKRLEVIKQRFTEDLQKFEDNFNRYCEMYKDDIFAVYATGMSINLKVNDDFDERSINFGTSIDYSDGEENIICRELKNQCFEHLMSIAKEKFNLTSKMNNGHKTVYINLDHPGIDVSLRDTNVLRIQPKKGSKYSCINPNIVTSSSWNNYISIDELTIDRYNTLKSKLEESQAKPEFLYIYCDKIIKFINNEWYIRDITFDEALKFKSIQKKDYDIIINLGLGMIYTTVDFVMERFRFMEHNNNKMIVVTDSNLGSSAFYESSQIIISELKKQLGRDMWNTFLLINEVSDE